MNIGILPSVNFTKRRRVVKPGTNVCSRFIRLMNNQTKGQRLLFPKMKRKRRHECGGYCENCTTIGLRLARLGCVKDKSDVPKQGLEPCQKHLQAQTERLTMRTSRSPTTVMTANGEVQTREEGTVYVKELDLFVKVMLLDETPAVLSLEKLCEDHGYTYHWISGQKPHLIRNGKRIVCNKSNYVAFVVLGLSESSSSTTPSPTSPSSSSQDSLMSTETPKIQYKKWKYE